MCLRGRSRKSRSLGSNVGFRSSQTKVEEVKDIVRDEMSDMHAANPLICFFLCFVAFDTSGSPEPQPLFADTISVQRLSENNPVTGVCAGELETGHLSSLMC
ncbi:UNVERIFIED_CONTAM: hypothetical protein K2H54_077047 [Gekko kuhli]